MVSGISTGSRLAPYFKGKGIDVIHVKPKLQDDLGYTHTEKDYIANLEEYEPAILANRLQSMRTIKAVIPGAEAGVDLAEKLNQSLGLSNGNDHQLSHTRRNKFNMQEELQKKGVRSIRQFQASRLEDFLQWKDTNAIGYPIVFKPLESAGTDNVFICQDEMDAQVAFKTIHTSVNIFKEKNEYVLCQEYIGGQEYMVNTVSVDGQHRIIETLRVDKIVIGNKPLYDKLCLQDPNHEDFEIINPYLKDVYKALGITNGAAHAEVKIWLKDGGKVATLIEVGTRLGGTASPSALIKAQRHSQLSVLVESYINPDFLSQIPHKGIIPQKNVQALFLISPIEGTIIKQFNPEPFRQLMTYHSLHFSYKPGDYLPKTIDLMNCPGFVYFVGDDQDIMKDIEKIRSWEQKHLYKELLMPQ